MKRINVTVCARTNEYGALLLHSGKTACCCERQQMMQVDIHTDSLGLELFWFHRRWFLDHLSNRTSLDKFFMVHRSAQGTGWSALDTKGFKGFQTWLVEEVGAGQEHSTSAWCLCVWREARAAQPSQTDGTVPDVSLDNLSGEQMNETFPNELLRFMEYARRKTRKVCTEFCCLIKPGLSYSFLAHKHKKNNPLHSKS